MTRSVVWKPKEFYKVAQRPWSDNMNRDFREMILLVQRLEYKFDGLASAGFVSEWVKSADFLCREIAMLKIRTHYNQAIEKFSGFKSN